MAISSGFMIRVMTVLATMASMTFSWLHGIQTSITRVRSQTLHLACQMLITDLDRSFMSLFHMDNHIMVEVLQMMEAEQAYLQGSAPGS